MLTIVPNVRCAYNANLLMIQADGWQCIGARVHGAGGGAYSFRKGSLHRFVVASRNRIMSDTIASVA